MLNAVPVDARHHLVALVAPPVRAGDAVQLERVGRKLARRADVRALAHVEERAVPVEAQLLQALLARELAGVLGLEGLAHLAVDGRHRRVERQIVVREGLPGGDDLAHLGLDGRQVRLADGLREDEVVVEPVVDRRPEAELRAGEERLNGLRHHVRQRVADAVQLVVYDLGFDDGHGALGSVVPRAEGAGA